MADALGAADPLMGGRRAFDPSGPTLLTSGVLKLRTSLLSLIGGLFLLAALALLPGLTGGTAHAAAVTGTTSTPIGDTTSGQEAEDEDEDDAEAEEDGEGEEEDNDDDVWITLAVIMLVVGGVLGVGLAAYGLSAE